jgi:hypothetical protein
MISLATPSRKPIHFRPGHPPATSPSTQSPLSISTTLAASPLFTVQTPAREPTSHPYRQAESLLPSFPASVDPPKSP